jgi:hypothetical protein
VREIIAATAVQVHALRLPIKSDPMHDIFLNRTLRLTVVGTISLLTLTFLILTYQALFDGICGNLFEAIRQMTWGAVAGCGALLLIRYRTDLIDS